MDITTIHIRPPHGQGSVHRNAAQTQAVTAASATAIAVMPSGFSLPLGQGAWVSFICTVACHIRFGANTGLDGAVGAATTSDKLIPANTEVQYWCNFREDTHFSVIREGGADGALTWNPAD